MAEEQPIEETTVPQRAFGPIQTPKAPQGSPTPTPVPASGLTEERIIALIRAAMQGQGGNSGAPAPAVSPIEDQSPEDQRLITAAATIHPSGRDVRVTDRTEIANSLFFVKYSYTPATGTPQKAVALVFDDGENTHVFGGQ